MSTPGLVLAPPDGIGVVVALRPGGDGGTEPAGRGGLGDAQQWQAPLANALQQAQAIYLVGGAFVGIAYQPFILMLIGLQCGLWSYLRRLEREAAAPPRRAAGIRPALT